MLWHHGHSQTLGLEDLLNRLEHVLRGALSRLPGLGTLRHKPLFRIGIVRRRCLLGAFFEDKGFCLDGESANECSVNKIAEYLRQYDSAPAVRRMYIPSRTSIEAFMNLTAVVPAIPPSGALWIAREFS
jgi:hypothetical protein